MLSPQRRGHGRQTRTPVAPQGDPVAVEGGQAAGDSQDDLSGSDMVSQMAYPFRRPRFRRTQKPIASSASNADGVCLTPREPDRADAPTAGQTEGGADWPWRHSSRVKQATSRPPPPVAHHHQTGLASRGFSGHRRRSTAGLLRNAAHYADRNDSRSRLDLPLSRRGPQGVRVSYPQLAHAGMPSNDRGRQKRRDRRHSHPGYVENPWNSALSATGQRRRVLWGLQSAARLWPVRSTVLVCRRRTHLSAGGRTRTQWRSRAVEWTVGACLLGTTSVWRVLARSAGQPRFREMVSDQLRSTVLERANSDTSPTRRTPTSADGRTHRPVARPAAHYGGAPALHSTSSPERHDYLAQRNVEGEQTLGGQVCVGNDHHPPPSAGHLVSAICST